MPSLLGVISPPCPCNTGSKRVGFLTDRVDLQGVYCVFLVYTLPLTVCC